MPKLVIEGGAKLKGDVTISGSKNATMPILISTILLDNNFNPSFLNPATTQDIIYVIQTLREVGFDYEILFNKFTAIKFVGQARNIKTNITASKIAGLIRTSILFIGPMLARFGYIKLPFPGGCSIGERKIDIHLDAMTRLGASVFQGDDYAELSAPNGLIGCEMDLRFSSVGASQNIIMACVLAKGTSVISNIATEPEVMSLIAFLQFCGADITLNASVKQVVIKGTNGNPLNPSKKDRNNEFRIPSDRIEIGTFITLAALTDSQLVLHNAHLSDIDNIVGILQKIGCFIQSVQDGLLVSRGLDGIQNCDIETNIHPAFPTDLQPQVTTLFCLGDKKCKITETIFENRFAHVAELLKIGAKMSVDGRDCVIEPVKSFSDETNIELIGHDLRASAAVVMAALARPKGTVTTITNSTQLDRGYDLFDAKLNKCGAKIKRIV
jgi:UDP-N-acetylglucosamine 1-carboxyvinyltransferase